jgi:hypothetical protein
LLDAAATVLTVVELKELCKTLRVSTPAFASLSEGFSTASSVAAAAGAGGSAAARPPDRASLLLALWKAVRSQRDLFGGYLKLSRALIAVLAVSRNDQTPSTAEGPASAVTSSGSDASLDVIRFHPAFFRFYRRAHAVFYIATGTALLSSGAGTGLWPIRPLPLHDPSSDGTDTNPVDPEAVLVDDDADAAGDMDDGSDCWSEARILQLLLGAGASAAENSSNSVLPAGEGAVAPDLLLPRPLKDADDIILLTDDSEVEDGAAVEPMRRGQLRTKAVEDVFFISDEDDEGSSSGSGNSKTRGLGASFGVEAPLASTRSVPCMHAQRAASDTRVMPLKTPLPQSRPRRRAIAGASGGPSPWTLSSKPDQRAAASANEGSSTIRGGKDDARFKKGSKYADTAAAMDTPFIPAGAGAGTGSLGVNWETAMPISSRHFTPPLFSPALLQTFKKILFAPITVSLSTALFPSRPLFLLLEAVHAFRAQVDTKAVLALVPSGPGTAADKHADKDKETESTAKPKTIRSTRKEEKTAHLQLERLVKSSPCSAVGGEVSPSALSSSLLFADAIEEDTSSNVSTDVSSYELPPMSGFDLLPYAPLLVGLSITEWFDCVLTRQPQRLLRCSKEAYSAALALTAYQWTDDEYFAAPAIEAVGAFSLAAICKLCGPFLLEQHDILAEIIPAPSPKIAQALSQAHPVVLVAYRTSVLLSMSLAFEQVKSPRVVEQPWLRQLTASAILSTLLWESIDPLERGGLYEHTIPFLCQLVSCPGPFTPHRSGRWWTRLVLNLSFHLKLQGDAADATTAALLSPHVRLGDRLTIGLRVQKNGKDVQGPNSKQREQASESPMNHIDVESYTHEGNCARTSSATNSIAAAGAECTESEDPDMPFWHELQKRLNFVTHRGELRVDTFARSPVNLSTGQRSVFVLERAPSDQSVPAAAGDVLFSSSSSSRSAHQLEEAGTTVDMDDFIDISSQSNDAATASTNAKGMVNAAGRYYITDKLLSAAGWSYLAGPDKPSYVAPSHPKNSHDAAHAVPPVNTGIHPNVNMHATTSVEGLSLAHYHETDGWRGLHCEGAPLQMLFSLLMWDLLFMPLPDIFATPYQDGPLDLDAPSVFYTQRKDAICRRLLEIAAWDANQIADAVAASCEQNSGRICRGVRWERYPTLLLQILAVGIGPRPLAAVFDAMCLNYKQLSSGMPDLLLWRVSTASAHASSTPLDFRTLRIDVAFVEVKGPNDHLSDKQHAWLRILLAAGADARVCKIVREPLEHPTNDRAAESLVYGSEMAAAVSSEPRASPTADALAAAAAKIRLRTLS